tara:strand:+ start:825 stop:1700 length:876 start_codon:yes stop_codon:yes gene_type:complete
MYIFINLFILLTVIFLYIHINHNIKTSNYLEIYEIDSPSKDYLEDICNKKQPTMIKNLNIDNIINYNLNYLESNYGSFELNVCNNMNNHNIKLILSDSIKLFDNDISSTYISCNNMYFIKDTTLEKTLSNIDMFFRPINTVYKEYDLLIGSKNAYTKMKSELYSRNYLVLVQGSIELILTPPRYSSYLHSNINYENLEYISNLNLHNDNNKDNNIKKIKMLNIILNPGEIIFIPSYWFYSIKILEDDTLIYNFKYRTLMYNISIIPKLIGSILQKNNTHHIFTKILDAKIK